MKMGPYEWLDQVKPGDKVIVSDGAMRGDRLGRVERLTKTQIILESGGRYQRSTGHAIGRDTYSLAKIEEPTEGRLRDVRHKQNLRYIRHFAEKKLSSITPEHAEAIISAMRSTT